MRHIVQPGHPLPERIQWVEARGKLFSFTMQAGLPLLEAARRGFAHEGFVSGVLNFRLGAVGPFAYVMPALSKTAEHAAFYSETFRPQGITALTSGAMTFGIRDGMPFFHCHALWTEAEGKQGGGHILPEETMVAAPFVVEAFGIEGALFAAEPDPETNFKLFGPLPSSPLTVDTPSRAFALRLRPNQDLSIVLENFCRERGISRARLRGGVGSIIGAHFSDGRTVEPFATEMLVRSGLVRLDDKGELRAELDVALVDHTGDLSEGRLMRGDNPILMTMEMVLEEA